MPQFVSLQSREAIVRTLYGRRLEGSSRVEYRDRNGGVSTGDVSEFDDVTPCQFVLFDGRYPASRYGPYDESALEEVGVLTRRDRDERAASFAVRGQAEAKCASIVRWFQEGDPKKKWLYNFLNDAPVEIEEHVPRNTLPEAVELIRNRGAPPFQGVAVPPDRVDELTYEIQRWLGQHVSRTYSHPVEGDINSAGIGRGEYFSYKATIVGVFFTQDNQPRDVATRPLVLTYGMLMQWEKNGETYTQLDTLTRKQLNNSTDLGRLPDSLAERIREIGREARAPPRWSPEEDVYKKVTSQAYDPQHTVARVFYNPYFYARVASYTLNQDGTAMTSVTLDFGRHYAELHGRSTRRFSNDDCRDHKLSILEAGPETDAWNSMAEADDGQTLMEIHNQFLALRFSESTILAKREWLVNSTTSKFYRAHFIQQAEGGGRGRGGRGRGGVEGARGGRGRGARGGRGRGARGGRGRGASAQEEAEEETVDSLSDGSLYADLWLHRCLLDRLPMRTRCAVRQDTEVQTAEIVGRIRDAAAHARRIVPPEVLDTIDQCSFGERRLFDDSENIDDDVAVPEEEEEGKTNFIAYPDSWYIPWNAMKSPLTASDWKAWKLTNPLRIARAKMGEDGTIHFEISFDDSHESYLQHLARYFSKNTWQPPTNDGFYQIARSSLLNSAQLNSLYSTIGTRAHLRLATLAIVKAREDGTVVRSTQNGKALRIGSTLYFAPAEIAPSQGAALRPFTREEGHRARISQPCFDFSLAEGDTSIGFDKYTRLVQQPPPGGADPLPGFDEAPPWGVRGLERILEFVFDRPEYRTDDQPLKCSIVGVEVPVFNPFCLFAKKATSKRFFLQQTQADFVCHMHSETTGRGPLVIGEYKTLMETNNPVSRVDNVRNIRQVFANARMLEAMTNVVATHGVILYFTRRRFAYAVSFSIIGEADTNDEDQRDDSFYDKIFRGTMMSPLAQKQSRPLRVLYADNAFRIALAEGVERTPSFSSFKHSFPRVELWDSLQLLEADEQADEPTAIGFNEKASTQYPNNSSFRKHDVQETYGVNERSVLLFSKSDRAVFGDWVQPPEEELVSDDEQEIQGGDGGGPGPEGDEEDEAEEEGAEEEAGPPAGPAPPPRRSRRIADRRERLGAAPPFTGAGPLTFDRRLRSNNDFPEQRTLYEEARQASEAIVGRIRLRYGHRLEQDIYADVNSFFRYLKEYNFQGRGVEPPPDWDAAGVAEGGRFAPLRVGGGAEPLDRMQVHNLNQPQEEYPTRDEDGYLLNEAQKEKQVQAILSRTLNRLINERVQRVFILPHADSLQRNAPLNPANVHVTVRQAAEKFLHLSQREFWPQATLQWAITKVREEAAGLEAKVRAYRLGR